VSLNIGIWSHWEELCATVDKVWDAGSTCGYLTSPTTDGWVITSGPKIYIRPRYHELLKNFVDSRSKFAKSEQRLCAGVVGTSGIGKSNFLQFLLVFLVHEARATRSVISIRVTTMDSNKKASNCYLLFSDGSYSTNTFETCHSKVDYHLTSVRSVNKNDVQTLLDVFGCVGNVCEASEQQLVLCPGLGEKKVKRLYRALHEPFTDAAKSKKLRGDAVDTGLTRSFPDVGLLAKETRGEGSEDEYIGSYGTDQPGPLNILHGTIIADRKSSFQSHICAVSNMEEVNRFRRELLADPIVTGATDGQRHWNVFSGQR
jgi:energy-coupling factor transporter ATP-binding protein EcfA2